jgi:hypothetical protein
MVNDDGFYLMATRAVSDMTHVERSLQSVLQHSQRLLVVRQSFVDESKATDAGYSGCEHGLDRLGHKVVELK